MRKKTQFNDKETKKIGESLEIDWNETNFEEFKMGLAVELEHGTIHADTNVTDDDPEMTGRIALAHLNEIPDYYTRLAKMESDAKTTKNKFRKVRGG